MEERFTIQKLLVLRKLTRAVAELLRGQLKDHLASLAPLLRPRTLLGEFVRGGPKDSAKGAERGFQELRALYEPIAGTKLFDLPKQLNPPVELPGTGLEFNPTEYTHTAKTERETKTITVTTPLKWILSYAGYGPKQIKDLLATRASRSGNELEQVILHCVALHLFVSASKQTGVADLLASLRFPTSTGRLPDLGDLPITFIASSVPTIRPPDDVIIESTEISGTPVFEEVIDIDGIIAMHDPLRDRLVELVKSQAEDLLPK